MSSTDVNPAGNDVVLSASNISMRFGPVEVLADISVELRAGEVHALLGENGAGKSTLAKILAGVYKPVSGKLALLGNEITLSGPRDAAAKGIALIHQEPLTFPDLSVAENIFIGRQPTKAGRIDWAKMRQDAEKYLSALGVSLDVSAPVRGLSVADRQMIELASALSLDAKVLILDETTASLTPGEVKKLAAVLDRLKAEGKAIAFIGHRMEEIFSICDRISVLRDGLKVGETLRKDTNVDAVLRWMVGRDVHHFVERGEPNLGDVALDVSGLTRKPRFADISLSVKAGEIVGLAGLVGAGRTDVLRAIFGLDAVDSGKVMVAGTGLVRHDPAGAMQAGVALVPEDRQQHGVLMPQSIWENGSLAIMPRLAKLGLVDDKSARQKSAEGTQRLAVKMRDDEQAIRELSGGNQQKVVIGKWLLTNPKVLLLDEPTRGIDVGAKAEVHRVIVELAQSGLAVLMVSSDLPEVLALSDRVLVMRGGQIVSTFDRKDATAEGIIAAASGATLAEVTA